MDNNSQPQNIPPAQSQTNDATLDPGKTYGLIGFICAFISLQLVGLPLSIMGYMKSKKAGFRNRLALAGIILNSIFFVVGIIIAIVLITTFFSLAATGERNQSAEGSSVEANTSASAGAASTVVTLSEQYKTENGAYPAMFSQLNYQNNDIKLSSVPLVFKPASPMTVVFYTCGNAGNKVGYYDYSLYKMQYKYTGQVTEATSCTIAES